MESHTTVDDLKERASMNASPGYREQSTLWMNMKEAAGIVAREDWSTARIFPPNEELLRNEQIDNLILADVIPQDVARYFEHDYDAMAVYANKHIGTGLLTREEIDKNERQDVKDKRAKAQEVFSRQGFTGGVGQMVGTFGTIMADPIYLPTYFIPVIGAGSKGLALAKGVGTVATIEMGVEGVKTYATWDRRQELGIEYTPKQTVANILAAGAGVGVGVGITKATALGVSKLTGKKAADIIDKVVEPAKKSGRASTQTAVSDAEALGEFFKATSDSPKTKNETAENMVDGLVNAEKSQRLDRALPENTFDGLDNVDELKQAQYDALRTSDPEFAKQMDEVLGPVKEKQRQVELAKRCIDD